MCIFCKIINGELPSFKIYEDEYTLAFLDISMDLDGHTLVIPKKHVTNVLDCDKETLTHVMNTVKLVSNHYVDNCGYDGVNILNASGEGAQQSVFHLHFHILPRRFNDEEDGFPHLTGAKKEITEMHSLLKIK